MNKQNIIKELDILQNNLRQCKNSEDMLNAYGDFRLNLIRGCSE